MQLHDFVGAQLLMEFKLQLFYKFHKKIKSCHKTAFSSKKLQPSTIFVENNSAALANLILSLHDVTTFFRAHFAVLTNCNIFVENEEGLHLMRVYVSGEKWRIK